jgi:hypothetical protein
MIIKISTILFNIYDMILKFNESYNKEFLNKEIYFTEFSELISNRIDVTPMDTQNITKYFNNFKVPTRVEEVSLPTYNGLEKTL